MLDVADAYDPDIPTMENQAYIDRIREVTGPRAKILMGQMQDIRNRKA